MSLHEPPQKAESTATDPPRAAAEATGHAERRQPVDRVIFGVAAVLVVAFIVWGVVSTASLSSVSAAVLSAVITGGGWAFVLVASGFVVFALWLAVSRYGRITLGADGEEPEFRTVSWIAMMFSAGMGIGLMFYGVSRAARALHHPAAGHRSPRAPPQALDTAMATTLFHWTLHPWAIYAVVGLAIAYRLLPPGPAAD